MAGSTDARGGRRSHRERPRLRRRQQPAWSRRARTAGPPARRFASRAGAGACPRASPDGAGRRVVGHDTAAADGSTAGRWPAGASATGASAPTASATSTSAATLPRRWARARRAPARPRRRRWRALRPRLGLEHHRLRCDEVRAGRRVPRGSVADRASAPTASATSTSAAIGSSTVGSGATGSGATSTTPLPRRRARPPQPLPDSGLGRDGLRRDLDDVHCSTTSTSAATTSSTMGSGATAPTRRRRRPVAGAAAAPSARTPPAPARRVRAGRPRSRRGSITDATGSGPATDRQRLSDGCVRTHCLGDEHVRRDRFLDSGLGRDSGEFRRRSLVRHPRQRRGPARRRRPGDDGVDGGSVEHGDVGDLYDGDGHALEEQRVDLDDFSWDSGDDADVSATRPGAGREPPR